MADFRKWLLVLAVLVFAVSAHAQVGSQFGCTANPGQPPFVRDGGLAELVGDVLLNCGGGAAGEINVNFAIFMNTTVTNPLSSNMMTQSGLLVSYGATGNINAGVDIQLVPGQLQANLVTGDVPSTRNSILFANVTVPSGTPTTIRIKNVRVVAPPASNTFIPTQILEYVSATTVGAAIPITNPTQIVGYVQPGLLFSVSDCTGTDSAASLAFQQCISHPLTDSIAWGLKFKEAFPTAFKKQSEESGGMMGPVNGVSVDDEATQGTRLIVNFTNIPTGVSLYVTDANVNGTGTAVLVPLAGSDGAGGATPDGRPTVGSNAATCTIDSETSVAANWVKLSGTNSFTATWEVLADNPAAIDTFVFGVAVVYTSNTTAGLPALTTTPGRVNGTFAPISAVNFADSVSPVPRFTVPPQAGNLGLTIMPCVTNLLFPYVTSTQSYDTGIALVNTSLDNNNDTGEPFATPTQTGPCTVYFFGNLPIAPQTTPTVAPGSLVKFSMKQPLTGWPELAGFEGYIIARCNFQYGHGFAFIVDGNLPGFGSEGYLALVIPDRGGEGRPVDPFTTGGGGSGEQLVH